MKSFEKNLKDRFKDASSLKGIDADDIWKNIEPAIADDVTEKKPFSVQLRYLSLLLFMLFIIGGITWYQSDKNSNSITNIENLDSDNKTQDINSKKSNTDKISKPTEALTYKSKDTAVSDNQNENLKENSAEDLTIVDKQIKANPTAIERIYTTDNKFTNDLVIGNNSFQIDNTEINMVNKKLDENKNQKASNTKVGASIKNEFSTNEKITTIQKIASLPLLSLENKNITELNKTINILTINGKRPKFTLGAFIGGHTIKNKFAPLSTADKDRSDLLNNGHQLEIGYSFALEGNFQFKKNIFITTGIEYMKSKSEFNLVQTRDTIMINPSSPVGALTDAIATRTIKHHNTINYLSVPIMIGIQKSFGKLDIGTSAGVDLNFTKKQIGRSLNYNEEIAFYPDPENDLLPVPKFFLSYHLRPYVNINLTKKVAFQLRADIRYQNFQNSDFHKLKYNSILLGLGGGVQYKFGS